MTFSKWIETCPLSSIEAEKVAEALTKLVVLRHGFPNTIHSDQGRNFESRVFQSLCERLGMEKTRTSPFHPSGNAIVERGNQTLGDMLASVVSEDHKDWDERLPFVTWAFNSSSHSTTGLSPYHVLHGWPPRLPLDVLLPSNASSPTDVYNFVVKTQNRLLQSRRQVHEKLRHSQALRNERYNCNAHFRPFKPGDLVMLNSKTVRPGLSKCLSDRWTGPFEVQRRLGEVNYRIRILPSAISRNRKRKMVVHHDRLKPFVKRRSSLQLGADEPETDEQDSPDPEDQQSEPSWMMLETPTGEEEEETPIQLPRRSTRVRRAPDFYQAGGQ